MEFGVEIKRREEITWEEESRDRTEDTRLQKGKEESNQEVVGMADKGTSREQRKGIHTRVDTRIQHLRYSPLRSKYASGDRQAHHPR